MSSIKFIGWLMFAVFIIGTGYQKNMPHVETLAFSTSNVKNEIQTTKFPDINVEKNLLILNQQEGKWYSDSLAFSGYAEVYYENGEVAERIGFLNGKKEGPAYKWYPDGQLNKTSNYSQNRLQGNLKVWSPHPHRTLVVSSNYKNGKRHGEQKRWFTNGQLLRKANFKNGLEEGMQQAWLENGKIYINYEIKNGRAFGLRKANLCYELEDEEII